MPRRDDQAHHRLGDNSWHNHRIVAQREPARCKVRVLGDARSFAVRRLVRIRPYDELRQATGRDHVPRAPHHKTPARVEALEHHDDNVGTRHPTDKPGRSELMRRGSTYIALCGLLVACTVVTPASACAAPVLRARAASSKSKHAASPKLGSIHMKLLGASTDQLVTDGTRWAAYEPTEGVTRLMDTATGHTVNLVDPEGCAGGLAAIGSGEVLYECNDPECPGQARGCKIPSPPNEGFGSRRYVVEDINSGAQHVVPGTNHIPVGYTETTFMLSEIGAQWVDGDQWTAEHYAHGQGIFVNWHTGQVIYESEVPTFASGDISAEPISATEDVENLNRPNLLQPLCSPVERPTNEEFGHVKIYGPFEYESPFAVVGPIGRPAFGLNAPPMPFELERCNSYRHVKLPVGGAQSEVQLGGDVLSWMGVYPVVTQLHPRGHAWYGPLYRLTGLPKSSEPNDNWRMQHTAKSILVTVGTNDFYASRNAEHGQVYFARLPWSAALSRGS